VSDDARRLTNQQRRLWDAAAAGRALWQTTVEPALGPVTAALLEIVDDGAWALDVCCGAGEVALAAARRAGPRGRVVLQDREVDPARARILAVDVRAGRLRPLPDRAVLLTLRPPM